LVGAPRFELGTTRDPQSPRLSRAVDFIGDGVEPHDLQIRSPVSVLDFIEVVVECELIREAFCGLFAEALVLHFRVSLADPAVGFVALHVGEVAARW